MEEDTALLKGLSMSPGIGKDLSNLNPLLQIGLICPIEIQQSFTEVGNLWSGHLERLFHCSVVVNLPRGMELSAVSPSPTT